MLAPLALAATITLKADSRVVARFDPQRAIGATVDAHAKGENRQIFSKANVSAILSAGFKPLSYRLATELSGEAWHWNPRGTWSDAAHSQGYWKSDDDSPSSIVASYGYRLPRRGNTRDQARNNDWSRVDDGDLSTFWKSNPYLDSRLQWLLIDLGAPHAPDAIRIVWGEPFAIDYDVQLWSGDDPLLNPTEGDWVTVRGGAIRNAHGGDVRHMLTPPFASRWLRVLMRRHSERSEESQGAQPEILRSAQDDVRDHLGFAVAEVFVEEASRDLITHAKSHDAQSVVWVSSTDPWHRASDIDETLEQPGLDLIFETGLTRNLPMLTPVALLYGTPEDAAAEIRYLRNRRRNVQMIEMGEEPDGQNMAPEDYAALYAVWADALHSVDRTLLLGGPAFQSTRDRIAFWRDESNPSTAWMTRFLAALRERQHLDDFRFFSFEWYPFDDVCAQAHDQLLEGPEILDRVLQRWRDEGVPQSIPWLATEYGWSSYAARAEIDIEGALFNAEFVADFLARGGGAAYFYGIEPEWLIREPCGAWGNLTLFLGDDERQIRARVPAYWSARLVNTMWLAPRGLHELHDVRGATELLRAWSVWRPDGMTSMLVINKDDRHAVRVRVDGARVAHQYSQRMKSKPPRTIRVHDVVELPPYSITVITGASESRSRRASDARR